MVAADSSDHSPHPLSGATPARFNQEVFVREQLHLPVPSPWYANDS
jgi:hypothetical protein